MITVSKIKAAIAEAPPYLRQQVASSYKDIQVEWPVTFSGIYNESNDVVTVSFQDEHETILPTIDTRVDLRSHPEFKSMKEGQKLIIKGKISAVEVLAINLCDCTFIFDSEKIHGNDLEKMQLKTIFNKYDFHPRIKEVAYRQFEDGYFKEAIQNALVEVIDQVKIKAKHPKNINGRELDGDDLMNHVFSCDNNKEAKIKFNAQKTSLDKAEQRGFMNIFKGIVGIRDRKAHLNFVQDDPLKTIEYLSMASLLLRLLDENISESDT